MSVIAYTAKREIEKLAYAKSGIDISAAAADDSFNGATTSLSGLANDEWIKVGGFANGANNGWFQANGASTSTKITQDTSTILVTEAAGPLVTIQGYRRGYGQSYSIEFTPRALERSGRIDRSRRTSLAGNRETLLNRIETFWNVNSGRLLESQIPQWREFLASVAAGETFSFDPYGTIAMPDNPLSVDLEDDDHTESRLGKTRRYIVALKLRVLP